MPKVRNTSNVSKKDTPVVLSRLIMAETTRLNTLPALLRDNNGFIPPADCKGMRIESQRFAPILTVNDLSRGGTTGDTVRVHIMHSLVGLPTTCCDSLEGKEETRTFSDFEVSVGLYRHGVQQTCSLNRLRLPSDIFGQDERALIHYHCNLEAEKLIYALAGERGHYYQAGSMIIPTEDALFQKVMGNCVTPPTFCRHFFAGNAESLDGSQGQAIQSSDIFDLKAIAKLRAAMDEAEHPLLPVKWGDDDMGDPLYVLLVTARQWNTFQQTTDATTWNMMVSNAIARSKGCEHPVFKGDCLMFQNILVRKYSPPVRFLPNKPVRVATDTANSTPVIQRLPANANFAVDRAILLGGHAIAEAYASVTDADGKRIGNMNFAFWEDSFDGGEGMRKHIKWMSGMKKITIADRFGKLYDYGVAVLDTAVPLTGTKC